MQEVVVAIIIYDDNVLITKKQEDPNHVLGIGGKWHFVEGGVEKGESKEQALIREVKEETGLEIIIGQEIETAEIQGKVKITFFECKPLNKGEERPMSDIVEVKWVGKNQVLNNFDEKMKSMIPERVKLFLKK